MSNQNKASSFTDTAYERLKRSANEGAMGLIDDTTNTAADKVWSAKKSYNNTKVYTENIMVDTNNDMDPLIDLISDGEITTEGTWSSNKITDTMRVLLNGGFKIKIVAEPEIVELGAIKFIRLSWSYNRDSITYLEINGKEEDLDLNTRVYEVSRPTTFRIVAESCYEETAEEEVFIDYANNIYYGTSTYTNYDQASIKSLDNKVLSNDKERTIIVDAKDGEYIYYCIPKRLGGCEFYVNGFQGGFDNCGELNMVNGNNYTEPYYIYRSNNESLGETKIIIK